MNAITYTNRFGTVVLTPVTEPLQVRDITKTHPAAKANSFDFETAEKIALITENKKIQLCFPFPLTGQAYVILHDSPSTAAICSVDLKAFTCDRAPAEMLDLLNSSQQVPM